MLKSSIFLKVKTGFLKKVEIKNVNKTWINPYLLTPLRLLHFSTKSESHNLFLSLSSVKLLLGDLGYILRDHYSTGVLKFHQNNKKKKNTQNHSQHYFFLFLIILIEFQVPVITANDKKITKWHVRPAKTQISLGVRPVWSESSLCTQWVAKDPSFLHADSKDSDQTGRMPRLIWVFAGRTVILLVLSRGSSFCVQSVLQFPLGHYHTGQCKSTGGYLQRFGVGFYPHQSWRKRYMFVWAWFNLICDKTCCTDHR